MGNQYITLPVPTGDGAAAAVDVSTFGGLKSIVCAGDASSVINIEYNNDPGQAGGWQTLVTFQPRGQSTNVVACLWMRVRQSNYNKYVGGSPSVTLGGTDDGTQQATLPATAADGVGAAIDVSALGTTKTVQVGGTWRGNVIVEISEDGSDWGQPFSFQTPGAQTLAVAAQFMRVRRSGVPQIGPGLPIVNVCAVESTGGGGGGSLDLPPITPPALPAGITNDYSPTGLASAGRVRQAVNVASSSLSGLDSVAANAIKVLENLGPAALELLHQDAGSAAANRFVCPGGTSLILPPGGAAALVYDAIATRYYVWGIAKQTPYLNLLDYGAIGDGVTDNLAAFTKAVADLDDGMELVIPPGRYLVSQAIAIDGRIGFTIRGTGGATIIYPSDNTALSNVERCGFYITHCSDPTIDGIAFEGGTSQEISTVNIGVGIYASRCQNVRVHQCNALYGATLYYQEAQKDTYGTGDSIAVALGVATLTDAAAQFTPGMVGRQITLTGCSNNRNNGVYTIAGYIDATRLTFKSATIAAEVSAFSWSVNDGDTGARLEKCSLYGCRSAIALPDDSVVSQCSFEQPMNIDFTGQGDSFSVVGTTVTLTDAAGTFTTNINGKYIRIANATSPANDGLFLVTYISPTQVSYTNAAGVSELFGGTWWIMGGDKTGIGAGAGGIVAGVGEATLTASVASFTAADVGKSIRISYATSPANNGYFLITAFVSPTQVTYANDIAVTEAYNQGWGVDAYDNIRHGGLTYGSTHAIYIFAGRTNILIDGCTFKGIRTTCFKASGSSLPVRSMRMHNCYAEECGSLATLGADDAQRHSELAIVGCQARNVGIGRPGWSESYGIQVMGSRNVVLSENQFHYTRNAIRAVDGSPNLAGLYAIQALRYVPGRSQPVEDLTITRNKFTADRAQTTPSMIMNSVWDLEQVGTLEIYGNDGTLTKSGTIMTLTSAIGLFSQEYVGAAFAIYQSGGNDISGVTVLSVSADGHSLRYENAAGVGGGAPSGWFRIGAPGLGSGRPGGTVLISENEVSYCAPNGLLSISNVAPTMTNNVFLGVEVLAQFKGDCSPRFSNNRQVGRVHDGAGIRLNNSDGADDGFCVSWPFVAENYVANNHIGSGHDWGIGIGIGNSDLVDFPLLGKRGRCLPSDGKEEVVVAYGSQLVAGDTITVDNGGGSVQTYTYYPVAPAGNQFNSVAGLKALIAAQAGIDCVDYGDGFTDSTGTPQTIVTNHLRIRAAAASANTDGTLKVTVDPLCKTALVLLPNTVTPNNISGGRGSGSAGPTPDKTVIWSPFCTFEGCEMLVADNAAAQTLLVSDGFRSIRNPLGHDGGSNTLMQLGTTLGTEQFRWAIA